MRPRSVVTCLTLACLTLSSGSWTGAHGAEGWAKPNAAKYLPDSTTLATVGDRTIRVGQFVERYFGSWPEFRPAPDSAGRVEFLQTLIHKDVLGSVAMAAYPEETFEERVIMREHTERVLANVLFTRAVTDSIPPVDESHARRIYPQFSYDLHLRRLVFRDAETAERMRANLAKGRITWSVAAAAQAVQNVNGPNDGDMGWVTRWSIESAIAETVFNLKPRQISPVLFEALGYTIYEALDRRSVEPPAYNGIRTALLNQQRASLVAVRSEAMLRDLRIHTGLTYDTTNIVWASRQFPEVMTTSDGREVEIDTHVPEFEPSDTSRVLARVAGRDFTLGQFLSWYTAQSPYTRVSATSFPAMRRQIDIAALEPKLAELARARGLDRDPMALALIHNRREEMRVERLHQDSIAARIRFTEKERRDFYAKNHAGFMTYARVRFAKFHVDSKPEADSLMNRLRSGVRAEAIVREDSLAGRTRGRIQWRSEEDHGSPYQKILFGELQPGKSMILPPDAEGHFDVLHAIEFDPGHLTPYDEAGPAIDQALRNAAESRLLEEFLERHKRRMRVTAHPELVMRIHLVDKTLF